MNILITQVNIEFVRPNNGLVGFASLIINGSLYLSSIAIFKKLNASGYRIIYPSKGQFGIFYPINRETGSAIEQAILTKLNEVMINVYDRHNNASNSSGQF